MRHKDIEKYNYLQERKLSIVANKVYTKIVQHFTHEASVTSVYTAANSQIADWLMSVFVNEIALPSVCSPQGQRV